MPGGRDEIRIAEWILQNLLSVFDWGPYVSIPTKELAKAMVNFSLYDTSTDAAKKLDSQSKSVRIVENKEIFDSVR